MAKWMVGFFLSHNPAPKHRYLLPLADDIVNHFHNLCQNHFTQVPSANICSQIVAHGASSPCMQDVVEAEAFPLFRLPVELRHMVYREALVVPDGGIVRSFAPPALLHNSQLLRHESSPMFYGRNHFEITIKRTLQDGAYAAGELRCHSLDTWVWRRFLHLWNDFDCSGANCLRYVRHVELIYWLELKEICFEMEGLYRRLSFRLSSAPLEENFDRIHGGDNNDEPDQGSEEDSDNGTDGMWNVYPLKRLAHVLWRGSRGCPLASQQIDLVREDFPYWADNLGSRTRYKPVEFDDLDDGND